MNELKERIKYVFNTIPEETVRKAVMDMKARAKKLVHVAGKGFEGKKLRI